jgi:hypothetical protein
MVFNFLFGCPNASILAQQRGARCKPPIGGFCTSPSDVVKPSALHQDNSAIFSRDYCTKLGVFCTGKTGFCTKLRKRML